VEAVLADARHWRLPKGPVVVLIFNSFDPATTREVMRGIDAEARRNQPVFVLYVNLRRVAEAGGGFASLAALCRVHASRRRLVFANAAGWAAHRKRPLQRLKRPLDPSGTEWCLVQCYFGAAAWLGWRRSYL
jgi:hypothetical protein